MFDQANRSNFGIYLKVVKFDLCLRLDTLILYTITKSFSQLPSPTSFSYYWQNLYIISLAKLFSHVIPLFHKVLHPSLFLLEYEF